MLVVPHYPFHGFFEIVDLVCCNEFYASLFIYIVFSDRVAWRILEDIRAK